MPEFISGIGNRGYGRGSRGNKGGITPVDPSPNCGPGGKQCCSSNDDCGKTQLCINGQCLAAWNKGGKVKNNKTKSSNKVQSFNKGGLVTNAANMVKTFK